MTESRLQILMVRHAHADWVADEGRPLSERGMRDAEEVGRVLSSRPPVPEAIYSSPYPRALQTVEPLAAALGLPIEILDDLRERTLADGAVDDFPAAMRASWEDLTLVYPGGESSLAATERFSAAIDSIVVHHSGAHHSGARHNGGCVAVGTHGNVLGLWLQANDPRYGYDFWCDMSWPDVYLVTMEGGRMQRLEPVWTGGVTWEEA